jgi:enoyl-CoA hydratase
MSDLVLVESVTEHCIQLTINRPKALNALNPAVLTALAEGLDEVARLGARQLIVTGAGDKAFVAGADIAAMATMSRDQAKHFARYGQRIFSRLSNFPGLTIAAVNGYALGGGMELAMACDLILCAENAVFGQPEVNLGVIPGFGGTQRLVRLVGAQRALEIIATGRNIKADEAVALGIALRSAPAGEVLQAARDLVGRIDQKGPLAVRWAKRAIAIAEELDLEAGLQVEAELFARCFATDDQSEGMAAFLEKRKPTFTGT